MTEAKNPIRALLVDRRRDSISSTMPILIGDKPRHLAKRLGGSYETSVELASMSWAGWPGVRAAWQQNGSDEYPTDPRIQLWSFRGQDFLFHGPVIFCGIRKSQPSNVPAGFQNWVLEQWTQESMEDVRQSASLPVL